MKTPQYSIYEGYQEEFGVSGIPPNNLPEVLSYDGKLYYWRDNPGVWIEENELRDIINSHRSDEPIWQIWDCLDVELFNLGEKDESSNTYPNENQEYPSSSAGN